MHNDDQLQDEVESSLKDDAEMGKKAFNQGRKQLSKHFNKNLNNSGASMTKHGADIGKKGAEASKKLAEGGLNAARSSVKTAATVLKTIAASIAHVVTALVAFLAAHIVAIAVAIGIIILIVLLIAIAHFVMNTNTANNQVYTHENITETGEPMDQMENAWAGVFYEKYSDQSLYIALEGPDADDLENEQTLFSGKTYEELGGVTLDHMVQSGTDEFNELNISDINNFDDQLKLSSGFLSVMDYRLNEGYIAPESFIKPVALSGEDEFIDDPSLIAEANVATTEDFDNNPTLTETFGLGSYVKYKAFLQPSRVTDYGFKTIEVWKEDWTPESGGSPVEILNVEGMSNEEVNAIIEKYKVGGSDSSAIAYDSEGNFITGYYPVNSTITYKDWEEAIEKSDNASIFGLISNFIGRGDDLGLYNANNKELWGSGEPGISSGIPETTVAYAITDALTMYGRLDFTVNQTWLNNGTADHTQYVNYLKVFKDEYPLDADESAPLPSDNDVKTYKAVYKDGVLIGYMNYNGVATYKAPTSERVLSDGYQPMTCDRLNPTEDTCVYETITHHGSWEMDIVMDAQGRMLDEVQHINDEFYEDRENQYTFAAAYNVMMEAVTEGTLQTYTVVHADAAIDSESDNAVQYLEDYISHYNTTISDNNNTDIYTCYGLSSGEFDGLIDNAGTLEIGSAMGTTSNPYECEAFAIIENGEGVSMDGFNFGDIPSAQFAKVANALGFTDDIYDVTDDGEVLKNDNDIIKDMGNGNVGEVGNVNKVYGDLLDRYGGAYGIDPAILSLIIAENGGPCSGAYYNSPTDYNYGSCNVSGVSVSTSGEEVKAYNFTLRESTSEENSSDSTTFFDILRQTSSKGNTSDIVTGDIEVGSMETYTVNNDEVNNGKGELSGAEVSIKVASMKLQNLLEKYNYNIPMAIMAYNYGTEAMDATLKVYAQQTGTTVELAMEQPSNIGWFHYTTEIYTNPAKYIAGYTDDTLIGDPNYLYNVMLRNSFASIYAIRTPSAASADGVSNNTIVTWNSISLTDDGLLSGVADGNGTNSINSSNVMRGYYRLTRDGNNQPLKDIWNLLTLGQKTWDSGIYLKDGVFEIPTVEDGIKIEPNKTDEDIEQIITTAFAFNSDVAYEDFRIEDKAFWTSKFSGSMGVGGDSLTSSLSPSKVLGDTDMVYPLGDRTVIKAYGASYSNGVREVIKVPVIQSNKEQDLHSIAEGTVTNIVSNDMGNEITVELINNGKDLGLIYDSVILTYYIDQLSEINVDIGDEVTTSTSLAKVAEGVNVEVEFLCDGTQNDALTLVTNFLQSQLLQSLYENQSVTAGMEMSGNTIGNETDFSGSYDSGPSDGWIRPISGSIGEGTWYYSGGGIHLGVDFPIPIGTDVVAPANGVILNIANGCPTNGGYLGNTCGAVGGGTSGGGNGIWMVVDVQGHLFGVKMIHMAQDKFVVAAGDTVTQGQKLGESGNSGNSSGPHCHVEVTDLGVDGMSTAEYAQNWNRDLSFGAGWEGLNSRCENKATPCRIAPESVFGDS